MANCNNEDKLSISELQKVVEKLSSQVEEMRIHLGIQAPKLYPIDYGPPGKRTELYIDELPQIIDSNASFTLEGPNINVLRQLEKELIGPKDAVFLLASVYRDDKGHHLQGFCSTHLPFVNKFSETTIAEFLIPLANPERWKILRTLIDAVSLTATELMQATGLTTGQFYHHLKELTSRHYVAQEDKAYRITQLGLGMTLSVSFLVATLRDSIEEVEVSGGSRDGHVGR